MTEITKMSDTYTLSNGVKIPIVGFGTWQTPEGEVAKHSVETAIKAGYRHIDTAAMYGNEDAVGEGIKAGLAATGLSRDDLFVTTKLNNDAHSFDLVQKAIDTSLSKLGLDHVDLYLIHWPNPAGFRDSYPDSLKDTWRGMEQVYKDGKARAIGISNFRQQHLDVIKADASVQPMVNQIFLNPSDLQPAVTKMNSDNQLLTEAYSPLGTGKLLGNEEIKKIAAKYGTGTAQVLLRWSLQHGFLPLVKSVHDNRIQENTALFDFSLSTEDMQALDALHGVSGLATDPDTTNF
ncbi:aldo/keto reductase [Lacticaseibacillus zhaodongensis]|uniref:aldo/keto reductase n=1 Tax=Lacticaseibacillus zhaodongensis TaxID=2668065 RepID=UPI0012D369F3|nr:aldo/keto reductase [Lacticaseibacillus zhaodongensis]